MSAKEDYYDGLDNGDPRPSNTEPPTGGGLADGEAPDNTNRGFSTDTQSKINVDPNIRSSFDFLNKGSSAVTDWKSPQSRQIRQLTPSQQFFMGTHRIDASAPQANPNMNVGAVKPVDFNGGDGSTWNTGSPMTFASLHHNYNQLSPQGKTMYYADSSGNQFNTPTGNTKSGTFLFSKYGSAAVLSGQDFAHKKYADIMHSVFNNG